MTIYIDLDETLIHAKYAVSGNSGKRTHIRLLNEDGSEGELFYTLLRPKALELLDFCRSLTKVKMLTTATRDYALKHNEVFSLGFTPDEIIAREDYLVSVNLAYGSSIETTQKRVNPNSLLIDNLPIRAESAVLKQIYLGIKPDRYLQIREFSGKDPTIFENELAEMLKTIKDLVLNNKEANLKSPKPLEIQI